MKQNHDLEWFHHFEKQSISVVLEATEIPPLVFKYKRKWSFIHDLIISEPKLMENFQIDGIEY